MTEKQLKKLGFKKEKDNSDMNTPFYYYSLDIGQLCFITRQAHDEIIDKNDWSVELFECNTFEWKKYKHLKAFIKELKKAINKPMTREEAEVVVDRANVLMYLKEGHLNITEEQREIRIKNLINKNK